MDDTALPSARFGLVLPTLFAGALGLAPLGLQPVLTQAGGSYGGLLSGGELAAMAVACMLFVNRPLSPVLFGLMMASGHLGALSLWADLVLPARLCAGAGEGGLCALAVRALLRDEHPIRAASLFTALTTLPQITGWLVQLWQPGLVSACLFLAMSGILAAVIVYTAGEPVIRQWLSPAFLPNLYSEPHRDVRLRSTLALMVMIGLIAVLNFLGNLVWVGMAEWHAPRFYSDAPGMRVILFLNMLGQIATTLAMARFAPRQGIGGWLILACLLEALGVSGMALAPSQAVCVVAGLLATAAWQATLPLATGLYLMVAGRAQGHLILPASLGGMALASGMTGHVSPQDVVAGLFSILGVIAFGLAGSSRGVLQRLAMKRCYRYSG